MPRIILFLYLFFLSATAGLSQPDSKYHIREYTTDNGLPSNGIKGLQWDEETGFLWIATEAGVVRFNGLDFVNYTKDNTRGLSHERMAFIVKKNDGTIFIADLTGNVITVKKNSLAPFNLPMPPREGGLNKSLYLVASGDSIRKKIASFMEDKEAGTWEKLLQTNDSSCLIVNAAKKFLYTSIATPGFISLPVPSKFYWGVMIGSRCFLVDAQQQFYLVKDDLKTFEAKSIKTSDGTTINVNTKTSFLYWENGMQHPILFSGSNAWLLYDKADHIEAALISTAIPSYSFIRSAQYSERNKTLFIATDSKGIIIISENHVHSMKKKSMDITERNAYYSQIELAGGNVLTNEGHLIGTSIVQEALPIKGRFSFSVYKDGDSLLWYAQQTGNLQGQVLHLYDYRSKTVKVFDKIKFEGNFVVTRPSKGPPMIATNKGLAVLRQDSLHFLLRTAKEKEATAEPFSMVELSPGIFCIASCNGLLRYNSTTKRTDTLLDLGDYCVRSLWKYGDYLFIGTYGKGYYIYKNGIIKAMPVDKNNFLLYTHCFVPDTLGYCWMSTNRGLFKAQLSDIINAFEKNSDRIYYHYFGKNDGMEITEMNGGCGPCALVLKDQTLSFPTMDGLLWVKPAATQTILPEANIYIDEFRAGKKVFESDSLDKIELPFRPGDIRISIGFAAWDNKENIYLDYQLNDSKEWLAIDMENDAIIKLSNLNAGEYKVVIRKLNGFGVDNYSYKEIRFSIKTPWHQQWWFYILTIFALTGIVALYFRFRTNQFKTRQRKLEQQVAEKTKELQDQNEILEKNNTIKTRLISIISHDIVTPLKFLTAAGKNLQEKRTLMPEELQQETIAEMTNTSQELQLLSTNILNWIKYQNENRRMTKEVFSIHEMVKQVLGILNSLAHQKGLMIVNEIDQGATINQFYEPMKILVYNLLTNAIHFSEKGTITVSTEKVNNDIVVSVQDEGAGMSPEKIQSLMQDHVVISSANVDNKKGHGLGFLIIKDLLKTVNASLRIESTVGVGSKISIIIPV